MKYCNKCGRTLPESAFQKDVSRPDGLQFYCRECCNNYYRARVGGLPALLSRFTDKELASEVARRQRKTLNAAAPRKTS